MICYLSTTDSHMIRTDIRIFFRVIRRWINCSREKSCHPTTTPEKYSADIWPMSWRSCWGGCEILQKIQYVFDLKASIEKSRNKPKDAHGSWPTRFSSFAAKNENWAVFRPSSAPWCDWQTNLDQKKVKPSNLHKLWVSKSPDLGIRTWQTNLVNTTLRYIKQRSCSQKEGRKIGKNRASIVCRAAGTSSLWAYQTSQDPTNIETDPLWPCRSSGICSSNITWTRRHEAGAVQTITGDMIYHDLMSIHSIGQKTTSYWPLTTLDNHQYLQPARGWNICHKATSDTSEETRNWKYLSLAPMLLSHLKKKKKLHSWTNLRTPVFRAHHLARLPKFELCAEKRISEFGAKSLGSTFWMLFGVTLSVRWLRHVLSEMSAPFLKAVRCGTWTDGNGNGNGMERRKKVVPMRTIEFAVKERKKQMMPECSDWRARPLYAIDTQSDKFK